MNSDFNLLLRNPKIYSNYLLREELVDEDDFVAEDDFDDVDEEEPDARLEDDLVEDDRAGEAWELLLAGMLLTDLSGRLTF